jgi:predicted metallopeptidase
MESLKEVLMRRDGLSAADAEERIEEAKEALNKYLAEGNIFAVEDICTGFFGLEPDYLIELMD